MDSYFGDAHVDTLTKLKTLAEKHGMKIRFGTESTVSIDVSDISEFLPVDIQKSFDRYKDEIVDGVIAHTYNKIWFELYDPQPQNKFHGAYHTMAYVVSEIAFTLNHYWESELNCYEDTAKLIEWVNDNVGDAGNVISLSESPTIINGFGNEKEIRDHRVYRTGMALNFFTELVCKFLDEPMIHTTY